MSILSKKWMGSLLLLLGLAGLCYGMISWRTDRMISSAYESCGSPEPFQMADLGLTGEQQMQIKSLQKVYRQKVVDLCQRHCVQKMKLADLMVAVPRDDQAVLACSDEVARLQTEAEQRTTEHILAMAGAMNPKQAEIFLRKFAEGIVKSCPIVFAPEAK
jgi:hypothetical protein